MAKVSGIEIYKLLPKTNCGDCNFPTCMAFAMQVAAKKAALDQCPHVSSEAQSALGEAQAPPMHTVTIGTGETQFTIGGETVLFRHEEKFHHPTGVAVRISAGASDEAIDARLADIGALRFTRVGEEIGVNFIAVDCEGTDAARAEEAVKRAAGGTDLPLILFSSDPAVLEAALEPIADRRPLIGPATKDTWEAVSRVASAKELPVLVRAPSLDELAELTESLKGAGIEDLVLQPEASELVDLLTQLTLLRRLALEKVFRPLGYPTLAFALGDSSDAETIAMETAICRYAGIVVTDAAEPEGILPSLTVRQNVYTDPQVPNAIEAKLYEIGSPGAEAPVILTTNFALTYFTVAGEVENSKVPAYISVVDTEGLGVLNAYADDKLTAEKVIQTVTEQGAMHKVSHNKLIIPGLVAVLRMEIQEDSGWDVVVGPEDAAGIPHFLRTEWNG
ncbi:MAG: acetyl-CoA decarbonylase/synthase complex subunit gamma [Candidatus Bipolaricaulota bacterium]|nr:MAG: acetyl-CoA decarbonylase/synthase complex subunit gamma [Candidatus Bipolaricaulota bacterium]